MARRRTRNQKTLKIIAVALLAITLPVAVILVNRETKFVNKAYRNLTGEKANLVIDIANGGEKIERLWADLAQGGEEKGGMLKSVIPQVARLNPRYIRLDHIYDFYDVVQRDGGGNIIYNWQKLDAEINDILATGAKPFLSLSYMPGVISSGSEVDVPVNWSDWGSVVKNTIEHISGTNGLAISDVYYEVWNEPDLFGSFKMGKGKDYRNLYRYAAMGAQKAQNTLPYKFGGPATTGLYKAWFDGLMKFMEKENLRLDFISWHRYSRNLSDYETDMNNVYSWLENYPEAEKLELIVSETGISSENSSDYDGTLSAIHTLSLYALASRYENLKIFTFEIKDGPGHEQYWGRWGLLTHENFGVPQAKQRYKAIEFLNLMEGIKIRVDGSGTWVKAFAVKNNKNLQLFIVNYDPFGRHYENVSILLNNLPSENVVLRIREYLGETKEHEIYLGSSRWKTSYYMKPNSAVILELISKD